MRARTVLGAGLATGAAGLLLGWPAWAVVTWARYGRATHDRGRDPLLDRYLPTYDVAEVHETRVAAPAARTYSVAMTTGLQRSAVVRAIFRARELLMRVHDGGDGWPPGGIVAQMRAWGWGVLAEEPEREIVLGTVTQPWRGDVQFRALAPDEFAAFDRAGYVKLVTALAVEPLGADASRFRVETRVAATDATARVRFRRYWAVFSPGIRLIRLAALRVVRSDAERRPPVVGR